METSDSPSLTSFPLAIILFIGSPFLPLLGVQLVDSYCFGQKRCPGTVSRGFPELSQVKRWNLLTEVEHEYKVAGAFLFRDYFE